MFSDSDLAESRIQLMLSSLGFALYFKGFLLRFHYVLKIQVYWYIILTANSTRGKKMVLSSLSLEKSSCMWFSHMTNPEPIIIARGYNGLISHP